MTSPPLTFSPVAHGLAPPLTGPVAVWSARHSHALSPTTCPLCTSIIVLACTGVESGPPTRTKTSWKKEGLLLFPAYVPSPHRSSVGLAPPPACSSTPPTLTPSTLPTTTAGVPFVATSVARRPKPRRTWPCVASRSGASSL